MLKTRTSAPLTEFSCGSPRTGPRHRASSALFCLLAIALRSGKRAPPGARDGRIAPVSFLLHAAVLRATLGTFLPPLAIVVDLALLFCAMSLTGGTRSPFAVLLPAGLALAWSLEGRGAAYFYAVASVLGTAALAVLGREPSRIPRRSSPCLPSASRRLGCWRRWKPSRNSPEPEGLSAALAGRPVEARCPEPRSPRFHPATARRRSFTTCAPPFP